MSTGLHPLQNKRKCIKNAYMKVRQVREPQLSGSSSFTHYLDQN